MGLRSHVMPENLKSIRGMEHMVREEVSGGGPAIWPSLDIWFLLPTLCISPLGIVPKRAQEYVRSFIIYPIQKVVFYAQWVMLHLFDAAAMIAKLGTAPLLAKCKIKPPFRLLPVQPDEFDLLGFILRMPFIMMRYCPWAAPYRALPLSILALVWGCLLKRSGRGNVTQYLDVFFFASKASSDGCHSLFNHCLGADFCARGHPGT